MFLEDQDYLKKAKNWTFFDYNISEQIQNEKE